MVTGYWHSRETFGTVDGPGIRYVLFLSGCPLGCAFCDNPDTWGRGEKTITADAVVKEVLDYAEFYRPDGGITISGGEPLQQPDFVAEVFARCHEHDIHTAIDTSGWAPRENIAKILHDTDHVLFSLKGATPQSYAKLTKGDFTTIRENLSLLAERKRTTIRYVLIPGLTDDALNQAASRITRWASGNGRNSAGTTTSSTCPPPPRQKPTNSPIRCRRPCQTGTSSANP